MIDLAPNEKGMHKTGNKQIKDISSLKLPQINRAGIQLNERGTIDPPNRLPKPLDKLVYNEEDYQDLFQYLEYLRSDHRDEATPREFTNNYRIVPASRIKEIQEKRQVFMKSPPGFEVSTFGAKMDVKQIEETFEKVKLFQKLYAYTPTEFSNDRRLKDCMIPPPEHDPYRVKFNSFRAILEKERYKKYGQERIRNGQFQGIGLKCDVCDYNEVDKIQQENEQGKSLKHLLEGRRTLKAKEDLAEHKRPEGYVNRIEPDFLERYEKEKAYFRPLYQKIRYEDAKNYNPSKTGEKKYSEKRKRKTKKQRPNWNDESTIRREKPQPENRKRLDDNYSREQDDSLFEVEQCKQSSRKDSEKNIFVNDKKAKDENDTSSNKRKNEDSVANENEANKFQLPKLGRKDFAQVASSVKKRCIKTYQSIDNYRKKKPQIDLERGEKLPIPLKFDYYIRETNKALTTFDFSDTLLTDSEKLKRQSKLHKFFYGTDVEIKDKLMLLHAVDIGSICGIRKSNLYGISMSTTFGQYPAFLICFRHFLSSDELHYMEAKDEVPVLKDEKESMKKRKNIFFDTKPTKIERIIKSNKMEPSMDELLHDNQIGNSYKNSCRLLLHYGADIDCCENEHKQTALHLACKKGLINHVKWLLVHGSKVDVKDGKGRTALLLAIELNHFEIVKLLIHVGASLACVDLDGNFPLHYAARKGSEELIVLLIKVNAPGKLLKNKQGKLPYDLVPEYKSSAKDILSFKNPAQASLPDILDHILTCDKNERSKHMISCNPRGQNMKIDPEILKELEMEVNGTRTESIES